jgi:hypothetical protein
MTQNAPQFAVVIAERDGTEKRELFGDVPVSIGRVQGNELVLHRSNVSKRHARLTASDERFVITDLGSTNGTYVNRERITQATPVCEGDRVYVGDFMLRVEWVAPDGRPLTVAPPEPSSPRWPSILPGTLDASSGRASSNPEAPSRVSEPPPSRVSEPPDTPRSRPMDPSSQAPPSVSPTDGRPGTLSLDASGELVRRVLSAVDDGETDPALTRKQELERCLREETKRGSFSDAVSDHARSELFELGAVEEALADSAVVEVRLCGVHRCELVRGREVVLADRAFANQRSYELTVGRLFERAALNAPAGWLVQGDIGHGWRLVGLSHGPDSVLRLRRTDVAESDLADWVDRGALGAGAASFLGACLAGRANVLIVGADADHGAQLADALVAGCRLEAPCFVVCERELPGEAGAGRRVRLDDSAVASADRLVELVESSRGRVVIDALHGPSRSPFVQAASSGLSGLVGLLGARSLRTGLHTLTAAQADVESNPATAREVVAGAFDLVIELVSDPCGAPVVARVEALLGASAQGFRTLPLFARDSAGLEPTGERPRELLARLAAKGIALELGVFEARPPPAPPVMATAGTAPHGTAVQPTATA